MRDRVDIAIRYRHQTASRSSWTIEFDSIIARWNSAVGGLKKEKKKYKLRNMPLRHGYIEQCAEYFQRDLSDQRSRIDNNCLVDN